MKTKHEYNLNMGQDLESPAALADMNNGYNSSVWSIDPGEGKDPLVRVSRRAELDKSG